MSSAQAAIVIPLLNQVDAWLEQCVRSALAQPDAAQVLVVTSPHTRASNLAVLARLTDADPRLRVMQRPAGAAFADAINAGFEAGFEAGCDRGGCERIGLLLSDDWLAPDALAACLERPEDLVATGRVACDASGRKRLWDRIPSAAAYSDLDDDEARACYIGHFMVFRREPFLAVGGVDPDIGLTGADDYDLPWSLIEAGADVGFVERGLYHYRDHEQQRLTLRDRDSQLADLARVLAKHGIRGERADALMRGKQKWYGEPVYQVLARATESTP